jgi:hypothetical protein
MAAAREERTLASIRRLGGHVEFEPVTPWIQAVSDRLLGGSDLGNQIHVVQLPADGRPMGGRLLREIASLPGVGKLILPNRQITDGELQTFRECATLECLFLDDNPISGGELAQLQRLPSLKMLSLSGCPITDESLAQLAGCPLDSLWLNCTTIGDRGLSAMKCLPDLTYLTLNGTKVTDAGLRSLIEHPKLETVYLRDTKISDEGVVWLCKLPSLKNFDLEGTLVTANGLRRLETAIASRTAKATSAASNDCPGRSQLRDNRDD